MYVSRRSPRATPRASVCGVPARSAQSTNTALRVFTTSERMTLANTATAETPVAIAALMVWSPSALTTTTASRKLGIARSTSTNRASVASTVLVPDEATSGQVRATSISSAREVAGPAK